MFGFLSRVTSSRAQEQVFLIYFCHPHSSKPVQAITPVRSVLCVRVCVFVFVWVKGVFYCTRLYFTLVFHCISLLLSCQFNLDWRLSPLQPLGCVLPGISPFWSWRWESRLEERTRPEFRGCNETTSRIMVLKLNCSTFLQSESTVKAFGWSSLGFSGIL